MIDLRSDTVTKPTPAMRTAMMNAEVGDDVYAEDPTVIRLQERVADMLGMEAALFVPSGVMANQTAIKTHTLPGDEVIVESGAHIIQYETGAAPVISGVQLRTFTAPRGIPSVDLIAPLVRGTNYHLPVTRLVCLENTHNKAGGTVVPLDVVSSIRQFTKERGIALHMDGARIWNACVANGTKPAEYGRLVDSMSVCFSKGLGAPIGSAIVGKKEWVLKARRVRKMLGGGMRQVGIIAAAALYALEHHVDRLAEDHANAKLFADIVSRSDTLTIDRSTVETNIVAMDVLKTGKDAAELVAMAKPHGVLLTDMDPRTLRATTHLDVTADQVVSAAQTLLELVP
ncbi:MAG: beta-eliminating lyase-related protein [Bacteroidetes bacterium]|jgi:threonine aldolase|nr:beta-eliminating lyase-related protein [Bacteroidota bacterium]